MKKIIAISVLTISMLGVVGDVGAQQPRGRSFGSATCAQDLSCSTLRYDSNAAAQLSGVATACLARYLGMSSKTPYFDQNSGLDTSGCLTINSDFTPVDNYTPKCCLIEPNSGSDKCYLVCEQIFSR